MNFSTQDFVTVNEIKADVLIAINDEEEKLFNSGFYVSQIQQALQELSFDSFFLTVTKDFNFPTETLAIELPKGAFNLKRVYVYKGDECTIESSANVWIKSNYNTKGANKGYTARNKEGNTDPFFGTTRNDIGVLFCSVQNGYIMFSSSCNSYDRIRLEYSGVATNVGDVPLIPLMFREAVKMYVQEKCLQYLMSRNPRFYSSLWSSIHNLLYRPYDGVWEKALYRIKTIDTAEKEALCEYLSQMNY